jgi:A/G-specific adenine glycosylase
MKISRLLLKWYKENGRELPWRDTKEPYKIWISEIILQQTRIAQGMEYYFLFLKKFPDIKSLANAEEKEVMKAWEGLGYYSRARNLHTTAKEIVEKYGGIFPGTYQELIKLKGIGPYTAGAILSIAFNQKVPAIDGNVKRILSRLFLIKEDINSTESAKKTHEIMELLLETANPSIFNQALMDLGSLICTPRQPDCYNCPLQYKCEAFNNNKQNELPVIIKNKKQRERYFYFVVLDDGINTYIARRNRNDIWKFLYQFPLIESDVSLSQEILSEKIQHLLGTQKFNIADITKEIKHILSHQIIRARFLHIKPESANFKFKSESNLKIKKTSIGEYPVPRLIENYLEETFFID